MSLDARHRYRACSLVRWTHNKVEWTEEMRPQDKLRHSIIDRIAVADYSLSDVVPDETTQVWFGGRLHTVTEADLHRLKMAVTESMNGMMEALADG